MTDYSPAVRAEIERGRAEKARLIAEGVCLQCRKAQTARGYEDRPICEKCLQKISV